jgi:hypothetical protein
MENKGNKGNKGNKDMSNSVPLYLYTLIPILGSNRCDKT